MEIVNDKILQIFFMKSPKAFRQIEEEEEEEVYLNSFSLN